MHKFYHGEKYSVIFLKLPKVNKEPIGENSPNLAALVSDQWARRPMTWSGTRPPPHSEELHLQENIDIYELIIVEINELISCESPDFQLEKFQDFK
jgi:hypothetical protein